MNVVAKNKPVVSDNDRHAEALARVLDDRFPKPPDGAPEPAQRPSVLVVGYDALDIVRLTSGVLDPRPWIDYAYLLTGSALTGDSVDLVVYAAGWRGPTAQTAAAAQAWRTAKVRPRFRVKTKAHELFIG
jgi:hypothetical protein